MTQFFLEKEIIALIDNEEFDATLELIDDYQSLYGKTEFYYFSLSDVYLGLNNYLDTIDLMKTAISDGIENDLVYERLGDAYYGIEDFDMAISWYSKCNLTKDNPNLLHTIYMMGLCHFYLDEHKNAINYFEDVLLESETEKAYFNCAISYLNIGKVDRAFDYFKRLTSNEALIKPMCMELINFGCFKEAEYFFDLLNEPLYMLDVWKSNYYEIIEDFDKSIEYMEKAVAANPSDFLKTVLAILYDNNGQEETSKKIYLEVLENDVIKDESVNDFVLSHITCLDSVELDKDKVKYLSKLEEYAENYPDVYAMILSYAVDNNLKDYQDHLLYELSTIDTEDIDQNIYLDYLYVGVHIAHERFDEALNILETMPCEKTAFFYKKKFICLYSLKRYHEAIDLYDKVMPDGKCALLLMDAFTVVDDPDGFTRVLEDMEKADVDQIEDADLFINVLNSLFDGIDCE